MPTAKRTASSLGVGVRGLREVLRALDKLPAQATVEVHRGTGSLAGRLTRRMKADARASSRMAARASETVRAHGGTIAAGPHPLLFLSEFGMNRRAGWYDKPRYSRSRGRQALPHLGGGSYWFFRAADDDTTVNEETRAIGDRIIRDWSA